MLSQGRQHTSPCHRRVTDRAIARTDALASDTMTDDFVKR